MSYSCRLSTYTTSHSHKWMLSCYASLSFSMTQMQKKFCLHQNANRTQYEIGTNCAIFPFCGPKTTRQNNNQLLQNIIVCTWLPLIILANYAPQVNANVPRQPYKKTSSSIPPASSSSFEFSAAGFPHNSADCHTHPPMR